MGALVYSCSLLHLLSLKNNHITDEGVSLLASWFVAKGKPPFVLVCVRVCVCECVCVRERAREREKKREREREREYADMLIQITYYYVNAIFS